MEHFELKRAAKAYYHRLRFAYELKVVKYTKEKPLVVIFQMGKVGSRSVEMSLRDQLMLPAFHIHSLSGNPASNWGALLSTGVRRYPTRRWLSALIHSAIVDRRMPSKILTLVRDPFNRNISYFFQNLHKLVRFDIESLSDRELADVFLSSFDHDDALNWFDDEVGERLGIDVYQKVFPVERGGVRFQEENMELLILRTEASDLVKAEQIQNFFGLESFCIRRQNVTGEKSVGNRYQRFKDQFRFPKEYVDHFCRSRFVQHFFSPSEILEMQGRWLSEFKLRAVSVFFQETHQRGVFEMVVDILRRYLSRRRVRKHRLELEKICVFGREFCAAPWQAETAVLNFRVSNRTGARERITVGDYCNLSCFINVNRKGMVKIGDHVYMNSGCTIRCDHSVVIGSDCLFGPNVVIWDTRNHPLDPERRRAQARMLQREKVDSYEAGGGAVTIEENVWVGMGSMILHGTRIGKGSVIGAGSVVTKDIPPMVFAAGVPARVVSGVTAGYGAVEMGGAVEVY